MSIAVSKNSLSNRRLYLKNRRTLVSFSEEGRLERVTLGENLCEKSIEALKPDLVLVALGVPKQEMWINEHLQDFPDCVAIGVGGLLDFVSERIPRAPMWMRKLNIEWCYRLYNEPIRLFRRYIIGNPLFIARVAQYKLWRQK